jgi:cyclophilin family peptidyl-prolyl cis-trans isomerase
MTPRARRRSWFDKLTMSVHPEPFDELGSNAHPEPVEGWAGCVTCLLCGFCLLVSAALFAQSAGPVIVVETSKGTFEFETYPTEAPRTVAHVVDLVKRRFYDGQRLHRALPGFLVQWGDPRSRDAAREADWGRGAEASSGQPIGVSEMTKKRANTRGAVAMAHPGNPALADSQIYVTLADRPDLNGRYTVFGRVIAGDDVLPRLERGDVVVRMYLRP